MAKVYDVPADVLIKRLAATLKNEDIPAPSWIPFVKTGAHNGSGSVRMRACYEREQGDIVITALPHQVSGYRTPGADRSADAGQEAAHGRGSAGRIGPREPDATGDRAALQPGGWGAPDFAPVRQHRPGA